MTVFDSPAVALHLDDNVTYVYTPADLALFSYVHAAISGVKALLQEEMEERRPRQNPFLTAFARGTEVYPKIEALSGSTNLSELETLAVVTVPEQTEFEALKGSIEALASTSGGSQAEMLRNRATVLRNLITLGTALVLAATLFAHEPAAFRVHESAGLDEHGGPLAASVSMISPG